MATDVTRRDLLQRLLAAGAALEFSALGLPLMAQGEEVVPFLETLAPGPVAPAGTPPPPPRFDPRNLKEFLVSNDEFFTVAHYGVPPPVTAEAFKLRMSGLVDRPAVWSLADLKARPRVEQVAGFECSGNNNARGNPLIGNARWAGTRLAPLLKEAGLKPTAREVVFFSWDKGTEELTHGRGNAKVEQHFARALPVEDALGNDIILAYEMNGQPLPAAHGAPLRLLVPGWYGVANVKWLDRIHVQETRYMGRFMARDYVTLKSEVVDDETIWFETWVGRMRLKSSIARVTRTGGNFKATGFALTDGTPLKAIEVRVDAGPWRPAAMWKENTAHSWKLFTYEWTGMAPGEHTIVSRAIDARGEVQPAEDHPGKRSQWENNGQFVRRISVA